MQAINKRFYNTFIPAIIEQVPLYQIGNVGIGVIVFPNDYHINVLQPTSSIDSLCSWKQKTFTLKKGTDSKEPLLPNGTESQQSLIRGLSTLF
jgi:hypothetical protein